MDGDVDVALDGGKFGEFGSPADPLACGSGGEDLEVDGCWFWFGGSGGARWQWVGEFDVPAGDLGSEGPGEGGRVLCGAWEVCFLSSDSSDKREGCSKE